MFLLAFQNKLSLFGGEKQENIDRLISFHILISIISKKSVLFKRRKNHKVPIYQISFSYFQGSCHIQKRCTVWPWLRREGCSLTFSFHIIIPHANNHPVFLTSLYCSIDLDFLSFPTNHFIFVRFTVFENSQVLYTGNIICANELFRRDQAM